MYVVCVRANVCVVCVHESDHVCSVCARYGVLRSIASSISLVFGFILKS